MIKKFLQTLLNKTKEIEYKIPLYGTLTFINFYLSYFFSLLFQQETYDNFFLRLTASILCFPLILKKNWPLKLLKWFPLYWYITLIYTLPFFFTFMVLKNNFQFFWCLRTLIASIVLLLLLDLLSTIFLITIGVFCAVVCYILTTSSLYLPENLLFLLSGYLSMWIYIAPFVVRENKIQKEKLQTMKALARSIAHEMRTPLAAIAANARGIKKYLPTLLSNYCSTTRLDKTTIDLLQYKALETAPRNLEILIQETQNVIDMLLLKVEENPAEFPLENWSIAECVQKAIQEYPFNEDHFKLLHINVEQDFQFKGNQHLMIHILFNLFKNALYYIAVANKGEIFIQTTLTEQNNLLYFKDTGTGIPLEHIPHIFDKFYSNTKHGTGLGLAFCKMVMEGFKGNIFCTSIKEQYTEFILIFPKKLL